MIFLFILGLIIGSFINSLLWRYQTKTTYKGRSICPSCKHQLAWYDNIPLVSWLLLSGKCRYCHKKISTQYPVVELITGISFLLVGLSLPESLKINSYLISLFGLSEPNLSGGLGLTILVILIVLSITGTLIAISVYDYQNQEIPNSFNLVFIILAAMYSLVTNLVVNQNLTGFLFSIIAGVIGFLFFYTFVYFSKETWMGGADAKLAFGMGLFLGLGGIFIAIFFASVIGAIIGLILMALKKAGPKTSIPFGPFLALGTLISLLYGSQLLEWYVRIFLTV